MNSDTNEGISNVIVKFYDGHWLMDSTRTNEYGYYNVSPVSARLPKENINLPSIERAYLIDIQGRKITALAQNELTSHIPSMFNLPSGTYFLQADNNAVIQFTTIEQGNIMFNPILILNEKTKQMQKHNKNMNTTAGADENWTLSVSDDGIRGQIGDYYDAVIPIREIEEFNNPNIELIEFYDMEDWDGDFLEYVQGRCFNGGDGPRTHIWGDYPQYYPVPVNLDSAGCFERNTESGARTRLELVINAFNRWENKTGLNLVEFYGRSGQIPDYPYIRDHEISIDWNREWAMFSDIYFRRTEVDDHRTIISHSVIFIGYNYSEEEMRAWFPSIQGTAGDVMGWDYFSPNPYSVMHLDHGRIATEVTNDDGRVLRTLTLLRAYTNLGNYIQE